MLFQMMKVDKSAESDATAALLKLKQKEQVGLKLIIISYSLICLRSQKETPRLHFLPIGEVARVTIRKVTRVTIRRLGPPSFHVQ